MVIYELATRSICPDMQFRKYRVSEDYFISGNPSALGFPTGQRKSVLLGRMVNMESQNLFRAILVIQGNDDGIID